jgi:two-component system, chemotaxis family, chemotaxis protein CheY
MALFKKTDEPSPRHYRMMIVDDSNIIRGRIERSQRHDQITVVASASNGAEAVELARQHRPDVVTMDITMPEMDGIECIKRILEINPEVLIIVVSALNDQATILEALKAGAHGFLGKPFNDKTLNTALAELLK